MYNRVIKSKGILRGKQRFQCKSCGRKFTYDTKQLTSNSHQPMESWIVVLEDTLSLASLDSTAEKIGVCHTTAFRINRLFLLTKAGDFCAPKRQFQQKRGKAIIPLPTL